MKVDVLIYPASLKKSSPIEINKVKIKKLVAAAMKLMECTSGEVSILLTDDANIRKLNKKFRAIDKATDVLSFPMDDKILGDVAISLEKTAVQAKRFRVTFEKEFARLLTHGLAHLLGHDHVRGGSQAKKMRSVEKSVLNGLKAISI